VDSVLNTPYEASLHVLLLLSNDDDLRTSEMIAMMDFIVTYGKHFGIADYNLLGDNRYKFGEFAARRMLVNKAIKLLVKDGMLDIYSKNSRFKLKINDEGLDYCVIYLQESPFAKEYARTARDVISVVRSRTEEELTGYIHVSGRRYTNLRSWATHEG